MSLDGIWKIVGKAAKVLAVVTPLAALGWLMISLSIAPFKTDVAHLRKDVTEVSQGLAELREEQAEMREEQAVMRGDMKRLQEGQAALRAEVAELREGQTALRAEMSNVSGIVGTLVNLLQGRITLVPASAPDSAEEQSDETVALDE